MTPVERGQGWGVWIDQAGSGGGWCGVGVTEVYWGRGDGVV